MKKLLTDIELDFYELKCLLEYLDKNPNDARLHQVAQRCLNNVTTRMSELQKGFDETYVLGETTVSPIKEASSRVEVLIQEVKETPKVVVQAPIKKEEEEDLSFVEGKSEPELAAPISSTPELKEVESVEEVAEAVNPEVGDMYRALSLNDVFRFSRELFHGDSNKLKEAVREMERLGSYEQAIGFLSTVVECSLDDFAFQDMDDFLKRFYKL